MSCRIFILIIAVHRDILLLSAHKHHECVHDQINHEISQQEVHYDNHPLHPSNKLQQNEHRKLLVADQYQPIRIRPYYDPFLINAAELSMDKIAYIMSLVSTSIHYLEQFVKVIPIQYPLLVNRCQRIWHYDEFTYNVCPLSDYTEPLKCQYATIPDQHIAESWYYDPITHKSTKYKEAGTGVANADLVIYVSYSSGQCSTDGKTLAWASICNLDQYGRPITGTINFCPGALDTKYWKFDVGMTLHEIMHILVMSNSLFPYFYNLQTSQFYGLTSVAMDQSVTGLENVYIVTDRVKQVSQAHFGCNAVIGAPLENNGLSGTIGSHWEGKYLQSELMCGTMYSAVLYLSAFTLALMEDTGWYSIDYEYSQAFSWGRNEGCQFLQTDCVNKATQTANFEQYWCTATVDAGCSYDYTTVSQCVNQVSGVIPVEFKWYSDSAFGGPQSHDYCAFRYPVPDSTVYQDYEPICWDVRGNLLATNKRYPSEKFGIDSRCVEVNENGNKRGHCFKHECFSFDYALQRYNAVRLLISDGFIDNYEWVSCTRRNALQYVKSSTYGAFVKCPNIDSICGHSTKPFDCYWGQYSDVLNRCICSVGYVGTDCSIKDMNRFAIEARTALVTHVSSPQFGTGICIAQSAKSTINGFYGLDGIYEGLHSYKYNETDTVTHATNIKYLNYVRYSSQWNIANGKGDISIYAYCAQSLSLYQNLNIGFCKKWFVWDVNLNQWIYDISINVFHCTPPTYAPTSDLTMEPSQPTVLPSNHPTSPTTEPTAFPTNFPSFIPTNHPTNSPTYDPTVEPTTDHTINPTISPSVSPTFSPTLTPSSSPTNAPIYSPTFTPSKYPTFPPTLTPSLSPTNAPIYSPTLMPSKYPTFSPTQAPSLSPTLAPTNPPTFSPTNIPSFSPTMAPSLSPTDAPTEIPTNIPTQSPTNNPTYMPTYIPTNAPTNAPINRPTMTPSLSPTYMPSIAPTSVPVQTVPENGSVNINEFGEVLSDTNDDRLSTNGGAMMAIYFSLFVFIMCTLISVLICKCCVCKDKEYMRYKYDECWGCMSEYCVCKNNEKCVIFRDDMSYKCRNCFHVIVKRRHKFSSINENDADDESKSARTEMI